MTEIRNKFLLLWLAGIAAVLLSSLVYVLWRRTETPIVWPIVWTDRDALYFTANRGAAIERIPVFSKSGESINFPVYNVIGNDVCYWSNSDSAIACIESKGNLKWYDVNASWPKNLTIQDIRQRKQGLIINTYDPQGKRECYSVDLHAGKFSKILDCIEARSSSLSDDVAVLRRDGMVEIRHVRGDAVVIGKIEPNVIWDYFGNNSIIVMDGSRFMIRSSSGQSSWKTPKAITRMTVQNDGKHVLFEVDNLYPKTSSILVYTVGGYYVGTCATKSLPMQNPINYLDKDALKSIKDYISVHSR